MSVKLMLALMSNQLFQNYQAVAINNSASPKPCGTKLLINHDGGADDAMAIFMTLLYEKYFNGPKVLGLMTTYGNVNESQAFINSQRILDVAERRDVPIYRGSNRSLVITVHSDYYFGYDGLGDNENVEFPPIAAQEEHAAFALIDLSKKHPGDNKNVEFQSIAAQDEKAAFALIELSKKYPDELIVLSTGPLTNIALAIRLDDQFLGRLAQLYTGSGNVYTYLQSPEFNANMDVEAYRILAESATPDVATIFPGSQVVISLNISNEWRKDVLGKINTTIMKAQNSYERISFPSSNSWILLDPAVAGVLLDPYVIDEVKCSNNSIILCGSNRGITTNNFTSDEPNMRLIYSANKDYYMDLLFAIFSADLDSS